MRDPGVWAGEGPWQGLLLAAAVLGSCLQPAPAQSHIALTPDPPPAPQVGGAVTLALQPPQSLAVCTWYRAAESVSSAEILTYVQDKGQRNGPSYTGRETGRPDCSLHITGLMLNDSSPYFLWMPTTGSKITVTLAVYEMLLQPKVISSNFTVVENRTLNLTCEAPPSTETLLWDRDGSVLVPGGRVELSTGNRTLTVPGVGRDDAGNYTCEVRNPINTVRSKGVIVTVIYGPVAAHITLTGPLHPLLGDNVTLTCAADSFPAPQFHWSHNGSDLVPALTSAVLSLVLRGAEQTGVFECHATNPHTGRRATTSVSIGLGPGLGQQAGSLSGGTIAGIIIGTLVGLGLLVFVFYYFWGQSKRHSKKPVQTGSRTPVAPHGPDVTRSGPLKEEEVSYSSVAFRAGGLQTPRPQGPAKADTTVYAEVKKK
ncbi:carcinoembryonic antigen-related cell adhesion molecule 1 [Alligator mississippiensis]|uniref:Carcinoembryonic antigen-related cell adhesion molecule 1 n=1 Tax=Alligator mississippiensis TaxID=8496 RepID=A0A151NJV1_ALLMI|nr:carcinoembryonic antigen-related cell adhesion molecule 1 [Alligator mississippiensis]